jgi:hypothetical protein
MISLKVPSSNGVSAGPIITAFLPKPHQFPVPRNGVVPSHDVFRDGTCTDSGGGIGLHPLHRQQGMYGGGREGGRGTLKSRINRRRALVDILLCHVGSWRTMAVGVDVERRGVGGFSGEGGAGTPREEMWVDGWCHTAMMTGVSISSGRW